MWLTQHLKQFLYHSPWISLSCSTFGAQPSTSLRHHSHHIFYCLPHCGNNPAHLRSQSSVLHLWLDLMTFIMHKCSQLPGFSAPMILAHKRQKLTANSLLNIFPQKLNDVALQPHWLFLISSSSLPALQVALKCQVTPIFVPCHSCSLFLQPCSLRYLQAITSGP